VSPEGCSVDRGGRAMNEILDFEHSVVSSVSCTPDAGRLRERGATRNRAE
jgi:hypothetical protein